MICEAHNLLLMNFCRDILLLYYSKLRVQLFNHLNSRGYLANVILVAIRLKIQKRKKEL
jgi:hypothetical protein